jgi:hypothetical protein
MKREALIGVGVEILGSKLGPNMSYFSVMIPTTFYNLAK